MSEPRYIVGAAESNSEHAGVLDNWFGGVRLLRVGVEKGHGRIVFEFENGALVLGPGARFEVYGPGEARLCRGKT